MTKTSKAKHRAFMDRERAEVYDLCYRGRLGRLTDHEGARCGELYELNPDEYGQIGKKARAAADRTMNPFASDPEPTPKDET